MKGRETFLQLTRQSPLTDAGAGPVSGFTPGTEQRCLETRDRDEECHEKQSRYHAVSNMWLPTSQHSSWLQS